MLKCDHCLLHIPDTLAVHDIVAGKEKVFCCSGCNAVSRFINDETLEEFYIKRKGSWTPGPSEAVDVDPSLFNETVRQSGTEAETDIVLEGIRCASCIWLIEKVLTRTTGVVTARANYATQRARVKWNTTRTDLGLILRRISSVGYTPKPYVMEEHERAMKALRKDLLLRFGTAAFFSMQLMMYSIALYAGYFQGISDQIKTVLQSVSLTLATPVVFYSGRPFFTGAARGLRNMTFNMDVLIMTGAGSAYLYSAYQVFAGGEVYFDTAAMIITLVLLGRYIEAGARGKASEVVTRLLSLNPRTAKVKRLDMDEEDNFKVAAVTSLKAGDLVQIKPGDRIPIDGVVADGNSEVDESMLTGESRPVRKQPGSEVFSGTQNLNGSFVFKVTKKVSETVLSQIIKTVDEAQARQAPVQALVDKVVSVFVPGVLLLSMFSGIYWVVVEGNYTHALMNAVSVLVIACPCALGLATPLAILVGTTRAAGRGILIKGGEIIERARKINTVILDKTGTVTEGQPKLVLCRGIGINDDYALRIAASVENLSEHSVSKPILERASAYKLEPVRNFRAIPGKGIKGFIKGSQVLAGSRDFIELEGTTDSVTKFMSSELFEEVKELEYSGATVIYLAYGNKLAGVLAVSDSLRPEARESVLMLKENGVRVMLLTGDSSAAAVKAGGEIGLAESDIKARVSPIDKANTVSEIQMNGGIVLMAGDGINDSPAFVQADVGISMGRASDIALESSDIVLMRNDLRMIPEAMRISIKTYKIIRQNLFWAFVYNIVSLPLAVAGLLHPIVAALAMTLSSLSVVGNSMRLRKA